MSSCVTDIISYSFSVSTANCMYFFKVFFLVFRAYFCRYMYYLKVLDLNLNVLFERQELDGRGMKMDPLCQIQMIEYFVLREVSFNTCAGRILMEKQVD